MLKEVDETCNCFCATDDGCFVVTIKDVTLRSFCHMNTNIIFAYMMGMHYYINCHSATQFNLSDSLRLAAELLYNNVPFQYRLSPCIADGNPLRSLPR